MPLDMTIVFEDNVEIGITGETDNAGTELEMQGSQRILNILLG